MLTTVAVFVLTVLPIVAVVALLELAEWSARRRRAAIARQIVLTDAIAAELGAIVAPVVRKPLWGPWEVRIAVPFARPTTIGQVLSIAHRVFAFAERMSAGRYRIVLTPQEEPLHHRQPPRAAMPRVRAA